MAQVEASYARAGLSAWRFVAACHGWTARAAERYLGPWGKPTSAPVLVIGNTYDPATPLASSVRMAQELADAHLVIVHGFGHTVLINPSRCARWEGNEPNAEKQVGGDADGRVSVTDQPRSVPRARRRRKVEQAGIGLGGDEKRRLGEKAAGQRRRQGKIVDRHARLDSRHAATGREAEVAACRPRAEEDPRPAFEVVVASTP